MRSICFFLAALIAMTAPAAAQQQPFDTPAAKSSTRSGAAETEGIPVPKKSRVASLASSEKLEREATAQYAKLLDSAASKKALAPPDFPQLKRLQAIASRLIPYTHRFSNRADEWRWEVNLIGSPQINAFVMPGGKIVFYTGIVDKLKLTDDEIAMVMGHEMAHALLEHGRERAGQQKVAQAATIGASVLSQVLGYGDLGGLVASQTSKFTLLGFSRGDESEADLVGMDIAARAGFDPRAGISLWQKMSEASKGEPPQFLSTHPSHASRIDNMRGSLPKVMPLFERVQAAKTNDSTASDSSQQSQ
jgi:Zn-dependent protease with chaperone function